MLPAVILSTVLFTLAAASPIHVPAKRWTYAKYFDLQGHRGGRGGRVENTLFSFASGIIEGATTLECDVGITKDGVPIVWHDEAIVGTKCLDGPRVADDPMYPYVGKYVANLTLAQIKTLDCGSLRQDGFPLQLTLPGQKISTLQEMFEFVKCATDNEILFNIESKTDPDIRNLTMGARDFTTAMLRVFKAQGASVVDRITHQSFDWENLIISKQMMPEVRTAALIDDTTLFKLYPNGDYGNLTTYIDAPGNWLAGIDINSFNGTTLGARVAQAAASIKADFLSPVGTAYASVSQDPATPGWIPFVNKTMVDTAHALGIDVKPWTINRLNVVKYLVDIGVDGIITDYNLLVRDYLETRGLPLAPKGDPIRVAKCLTQLNQLARSNYTI